MEWFEEFKPPVESLDPALKKFCAGSGYTFRTDIGRHPARELPMDGAMMRWIGLEVARWWDFDHFFPEMPFWFSCGCLHKDEEHMYSLPGPHFFEEISFDFLTKHLEELFSKAAAALSTIGLDDVMRFGSTWPLEGPYQLLELEAQSTKVREVASRWIVRPMQPAYFDR
jgi:hypothetical protein